MNQTGLAPSLSPPASMARARVRRGGLSSLEALERGFALFRSTFSGTAWRYYVGTALLLIAFIPMWVVDGQIRVSNATLFCQAGILAAVYLFRVWMVRSYMEQVRERTLGMALPRASGSVPRAAASARLLAWKVILTLFGLVTLPTIAGPSWFYAASQFASLESGDDSAGNHTMSGCLALAGQWFGGSLVLFLALFPLWIAVWLNLTILAIALPQLLHSIFGLNTLLSTEMGVFSLVESSAFWLSLFAGAWLALDPIVKCTFVVVSQHLRSRGEGDDLRGLLASLPREQERKTRLAAANASKGMPVALFVLATLLACISQPAIARAEQVPADRVSSAQVAEPTRDVRVQTLRKALQDESQRSIYQWHDAEHPAPPTWFDKMLSKIGSAIERAWNSFQNFMHKLWPSGLNRSAGTETGGWHFNDLRMWLTIIAALTLAGGGVLLWLRRRKEGASLAVPISVIPTPDLSDVVAAADRSEDEWFALASRFHLEGDLRLALRAAYFGLLAGLAQREWLTIRRDRTNLEYLNEFTRRWRRRPQASTNARIEVPEQLRGSLRLFDRVWYGAHVLTPEAVATYHQDQREFLNHV